MFIPNSLLIAHDWHVNAGLTRRGGIPANVGLGDLPDSFGTAAQKNVGTAADQLPTTSQADARYGLKHWSNSAGVVVATNTPIKIAHGLTINPDLCVLNIKYRCRAANNGYEIGDYCIGFGPRVSGGDTQAVAGSLGALITDEYCQFNVGNAGMYIMPKNSGVVVGLNSPSALSQWALEFHILYQ